MFERLAERMRSRTAAPGDNEEIEFRGLEEATEAPAQRPQTQSAQEAAPTASPSPSAASSIEGGNIELKVVKPESFDEVGEIADYLIDGCTVVLNTELLDRATIIRMLDFLNGVTYTTDGEIKNVASGTYIITPSGIDIRD